MTASDSTTSETDANTLDIGRTRERDSTSFARARSDPERRLARPVGPPALGTPGSYRASCCARLCCTCGNWTRTAGRMPIIQLQSRPARHNPSAFFFGSLDWGNSIIRGQTAPEPVGHGRLCPSVWPQLVVNPAPAGAPDARQHVPCLCAHYAEAFRHTRPCWAL